MEAKELKALNDSELDTKFEEFKQEHFNLRWQTASHQCKNPKRFRVVRRTIARILTIKNERLREAASK